MCAYTHRRGEFIAPSPRLKAHMAHWLLFRACGPEYNASGLQSRIHGRRSRTLKFANTAIHYDAVSYALVRYAQEAMR